MKKNKTLGRLILLFLLIIGFFYRIYGLNQNYSFWTDENHVAIFTRAILERGRPLLGNGYNTGLYQWFFYWLTALSAKFLGLNEFAIRFPSVIFGTLTIFVIFLLGKEIGGANLGLLSAILATFSKIEILWSRQARPYQALQFFYLLEIWFVWKFIEEQEFNWKYFLGFLVVGIFASLTHGLGLIILISGLIFLLIFKFRWFKKWLPFGFSLFLILIYHFKIQILAVISSFGKVNNLYYYRVFLWHHYSLLVFLAVVGGLSLLFKKEWRKLIVLGLPLGIQLILASFFLGQPFTRYFYIVFPFLLLFSAKGLLTIGESFGKYRKLMLSFLTIFIILMGNKFTLLPKRFYSLNTDMQEIPEVDWKKIYEFVEEKLSDYPEVVLITNWNDLPIWYLGENSLNYLIRKPGEKKLDKDSVSSALMIYSIEEFIKVIEKNRQGILIIDSWDDRVPNGIREFAKNNFKKEFEIDRLYPFQPRYWPVEVYSWGI